MNTLVMALRTINFLKCLLSYAANKLESASKASIPFLPETSGQKLQIGTTEQEELDST